MLVFYFIIYPLYFIEALDKKVAVTRQTISKWELGQSTPDLDFIVQLSSIFNVSSDYLIKDEMIEPDEPP